MQDSSKLLSIEIALTDDGSVARVSTSSLYQVMDDSGAVVMSMPRVQDYDAEDPQVETILGSVSSGLSVQVNRLQGQLDDAHGQVSALNAQIKALQDALDTATPADPSGIAAQVQALVKQELANAVPAGTWWQRFLGIV